MHIGSHCPHYSRSALISRSRPAANASAIAMRPVGVPAPPAARGAGGGGPRMPCAITCFAVFCVVTVLPYALLQSPHSIDHSLRGKQQWGSDHGGLARSSEAASVLPLRHHLLPRSGSPSAVSWNFRWAPPSCRLMKSLALLANDALLCANVCPSLA